MDRTTVAMGTTVRRIFRCAAARRLGYREARRIWPNCPTSWRSSPRALLLAARESLLVSLQDGLLTATGRLSTRPSNPRERAHWGRDWVMHSSRHGPIATDAWQKGRYDWRQDTLELPDTHYVDIQLMKIVVEAFWPLSCAAVPVAQAEAKPQTAYTTPYLELMRQAINEFRIGAGGQPKKEALVDWFRARHVAGQQVSMNMASYLATFVRQPETQRGGNRKWSGVAPP